MFIDNHDAQTRYAHLSLQSHDWTIFTLSFVNYAVMVDFVPDYCEP